MISSTETILPALVIDTNVLLATINRRNSEFYIYEAFDAKKFNWVVSTEILDEYAEKLTDFYSVNTADYVLDILCSATNVLFHEPYYRWNLIEADPDDNKFSDLALSANAHGLVTYDKHFDLFKTLPFPTLQILSPTEFTHFLGL
ncbi:putative toxin-antitoxin system toxin component, PIN family [Spirosoma sp. HMF3257]|uniref:Putative toxin-antitoxin system toxin component, PIN family n=1 Tax=Spirosoma telluris TaxID=2183553 RepID=A0A327NMT9_9BACT|nr:putative toxin-antitoxin system toxin component, PIN family [Spirosoma telluris]RAI76751.1 putative toxin-antitoxin system toxin component, PIN family [Spirosoma telluris]